MVNLMAEKPNANFAAALKDVGLHSWASGSAKWMTGHFSDAYVHEALIAHVRRVLDHEFPRANPGETRRRFRHRMDKVEECLNSSDFAARENGGLRALGKDLRDRCRAVVERNGERLSK